MTPLGRIIRFFPTLATILSPFLIMFFYATYGYHATFFFVILVMAFNKPAALTRNKTLLTTALVQGGIIGGYVVIGLIWPHPLVFKMLPVVINLGLLLLFLRSVIRPPTIIESFARQMAPAPLDESAIEYCRSVTVVWAWFFLLDAILVLYVALERPLWEWAALTGGVNYLLMGALFGGEYLYRKKRFGDYNDALWIDRTLRRLFKAQPE